jgi:hypothetical protein
MIILRPLSGLASFLMLAGCASTQLNYNTLDIAKSVESLYLSQALENLSKTIDNPTLIPSQVDIAAGTVQTSNLISPSLNFPLSKSITRSGADVVTSTVLAGSTATAAANDGWVQTWTISPITDGNNLRNLRALYRYVVVADADLRREYRPPLALENGQFVPDKYSLQKPHCVLCTRRLIPNETLHKGWLYWTSDLGSYVPPRLPPPGVAVIDLGHWGRHELFISAEDYQNGYLDNFVLFIMGAGPGPSAPSAKGGAGGGAAGKRFELIIPQQVQPPQQ